MGRSWRPSRVFAWAPLCLLAIPAAPHGALAARSIPGAAGARDAAASATRAAFVAHAEVDPSHLGLGERASYRGWVVVPKGQAVRWVRPASAGAIFWGEPRISRSPGAAGTDTARIELPVQVFALGRVALPGVALALTPGPDLSRLPTLTLALRPLIAAADTAATLRPLRGPLAAPWWERVDWGIVAGVLAALVALAVLVRWLRRSPRLEAAAPAATTRMRDPWAEAGAELAALRRLRLPEQGRFGEHALRLTRILRRLLERTTGNLPPGLTTSELVERLRGAAAGMDVARLESWLRIWDGIKFARTASSADEAGRAEQAVEALTRAPTEAASREVA